MTRKALTENSRRESGRGPSWVCRSILFGSMLLGAACATERVDEQPAPPSAGGVETTPVPPQEAVDPARPPPRVDDLLPPLPDYVTDDQAEAGELRSSLDHGSVPYVDVRRRLVLDERGFASAEISVVTLEPVRGAAEHLIDHRFGDAPRSEIRIGGEEVLRIETVPFATLVSIGPGFVMTFQRGQGRSDEWLEQLVEATLHAVALGTRRAGNTAQEWCDLSGIAACRYPVEPAAA